jgi:peptide methionine sulfoxide reductase MsrA
MLKFFKKLFKVYDKKDIEKLVDDKLNLFYYEIDDLVKSRFEEVGKAYDNLILKESDNLRKFVKKTKQEMGKKKKGGKK